MSETDGLPPWPWRFGKPEGEIVRRSSQAAVGLYVMTMDQNSRVYRDPRGISGSPVPRYHYRPRKIIGETRSSWLLDGGRSGEPYPKKPTDSRPARFYGLDDVEDELWRLEHAHEIARRVGWCRDPELLREVARLIGYAPSTPEPSP